MGTRIPLNRTELQQQDLQEKLEMSIAEIGLSVRTTNCLEEHGILIVEDLLKKRPKDLLAIPNFGEKTLEEVYKALEKIGFYRPFVQPTEEVEQAGDGPTGQAARSSCSSEQPLLWNVFSNGSDL